MSFGLKTCYFVSINVLTTAMLKDASLDRLFLPTFLSLFRALNVSRLLADTAYNIFDVCLNLNVAPIEIICTECELLSFLSKNFVSTKIVRQVEAYMLIISRGNSILVLPCSFKVSKYISECWPR